MVPVPDVVEGGLLEVPVVWACAAPIAISVQVVISKGTDLKNFFISISPESGTDTAP